MYDNSKKLEKEIAKLKGEFYDENLFIRLIDLGFERITKSVWENHDTRIKLNFILTKCYDDLMITDSKTLKYYIQRIEKIHESGEMLSINNEYIITSSIDNKPKTPKVRKATFNLEKIKWNTMNLKCSPHECMEILNDLLLTSENLRTLFDQYQIKKISTKLIPKPFPDKPVSIDNPYCEWKKVNSHDKIDYPESVYKNKEGIKMGLFPIKRKTPTIVLEAIIYELERISSLKV